MAEIPDIPDLKASEQAHEDMLLGMEVDQTEEDPEAMTPASVELIDFPTSDFDTPVPTPRLVVSAAIHDWIVGNLDLDLIKANTRIIRECHHREWKLERTL